MPGRRPLLLAPPEELRRQLAAEPTLHVAQRYGVSPTTMSKRRRLLALPARPRGRVGGTGQVEAAIMGAMAPGQWYPAADLRPQVPGTRARFYEIIARLCALGRLERRGRFGTYEWSRPVTDSHAARRPALVCLCGAVLLTCHRKGCPQHPWPPRQVDVCGVCAHAEKDGPP